MPENNSADSVLPFVAAKKFGMRSWCCEERFEIVGVKLCFNVLNVQRLRLRLIHLKCC